MDAHRDTLSRRLREIGVEERPLPGRDDGFAALLYQGREFAHFHAEGELDIRMGKELIRQEGLAHPPHSKVHPGRSKSSPWYEMPVASAADVEEAMRLVQLAIQKLKAGA